MIGEILAKYPETDFPANRQKRIETLAEPYAKLKEKWAHRVPPKWYGFDLYDVPARWLQIIDEFLEYIEKQDPEMEIHQIKLKFGGLRFYVNCDPRFKDEIAILEEHLYDPRLIH